MSRNRLRGFLPVTRFRGPPGVRPKRLLPRFPHQSSFEGGDLEGWSSFGVGTLSNSADRARTGSRSLKVVSGGPAGSQFAQHIISSRFEIIPGKTLDSVVYLYAVSEDVDAFINYQWYDQSNQWVGEASAVAAPSGTGLWTQYTLSAAAPDNVRRIEIILGFAAFRGTSFYWDDLSLSLG